MASAVKQIATKSRSTALSLWSRASTLAEAEYSKAMSQNSKYVLNDPEKEKILLKQWFFTKMSKIPAEYAHMQKEIGEVKGVWAKRQELTLHEVGIGAMFAAEVLGWYCIGEVIGRGFTLSGYYP